MTKEDLLAQVRAIRKDLTYAQGKITDLLDALARLDIPEAKPSRRCPVCTITVSAAKGALRDHLANVHHTDPETIVAWVGEDD